jgi:ABC-2 type transport system ATP-binding protein
MYAVETSGLRKSYHVGFWRKTEKVALHGLDLQVDEGEVFGFLGPNGAGKTTTLKILNGLVFATAGRARIFGMEPDDLRVRAMVGFLPEQPYFYDYLTAGELLEYYGTLSGLSAEESRRRGAKMLDRVGLSDCSGMQLRKFSKGMLQRVGIAQAILHDPKLLFLDEPMSGLDPVGRHEVRQLIQELADEGKTIFFSTHIISDAEALCDRVAVVNKGQLRGVGVVAELVAETVHRYELIWQGAGAIERMRELGAECRASGDTVRAQVAEEKLNGALDILRRAPGVRIISVNAVRATLEEYFLKKLEQPKTEMVRA